MDTEITPEQQGQLVTWAGKRDEILLEISNLQTVKEGLKKVNLNLADSNTDIENRMNVILGRIEELKNKEKELPELILKSVASLRSEKSNLETEVACNTRIVKLLEGQKTSLKEDVAFALKAFEAIKGDALSLEKVVGHVTEVSAGNETKINSIVENLKVSLGEMVEVNKKNVAETNVVINKVPAMLVELQKTKLIGKKL